MYHRLVKKYPRFKCKCKCNPDKEISIDARSVVVGNTTSCGCKKKTNRYEIRDNYVIMYTSNNEPFYVDLEDFDRVKDICWCKNSEGYLHGYKDGKTISLHRLILNFPDCDTIDHIGGKETRNDNRKSNLRMATYSENNRNRTCANGGGVYSKNNKWTAEIYYNKERIWLGTFNSKDEAMQARRQAEEKYYKDFCYNNSQSLYKQSNGN